METRTKKIVLGLAVFTLATLGLGRFFDTRCEVSCIGEAFAANTKDGLKGLEKFNIILDDDSGSISISSKDSKDGSPLINIAVNDADGSIGGDADNPSRIRKEIQESYAGKSLQTILVRSYITDWVITEGTDDKVNLVFKGYLPDKEWTVSESSGKLEVQLKKKGPLQGRLILPKDYKGSIELTNVSGDLEVEKLAKASELNIMNVSGDVKLQAAPQGELEIKTVSGDIDFDAATVNKELKIDINSVSGDFKAQLKSPIKGLATKTVNGDVTLKLHRTVGFNFEMEGVNASFEGLPKDAKEEKGIAHRSATGSFGNAPKGELSFNSVNGDFTLQTVD